MNNSHIKGHQVVSHEEWLSSGASDFNFDSQASFTPEQIKSGTTFYNYTVTDREDLDREGISVPTMLPLSNAGM